MPSSASEKCLAGLAIGSLSGSLGLATFLPVYTDEVTSKLLDGRLFLDRWHQLTLVPQCGASPSGPLFLLMIPRLVIDSLIYGELTHPLIIRLIGIAMFVVLMIVLVVMMPRAMLIPLDRVTVAAIAAAVAGLGVTPFLMVLNRWEQPLVLITTLLVLLPLVPSGTRPHSPRRGVIKAGGLVLLAVLFLSLHPRAVLLTPVLAVGVWMMLPTLSQRLAGAASVGALSAAFTIYYHQRFQCPAAPGVRRIFESVVLPMDQVLHPLWLARDALSNLRTVPQYWRNIRFAYWYASDWLPHDPERLGLVPFAVNRAIELVYWALMAGLAVALAYQVVETARRRSLSSRACLLFASAIGLAGSAMIWVPKTFYSGILVLPLLAVSVAIGLPPIRIGTWTGLGRVAVGALVIVSLISQTVLWTRYTPIAFGEWMAGGYLERQPLSYSFFDYDRQRKKITATALRCGLDLPSRPRHLVVDDLTYPALARVQEPFHVIYVGKYWGQDIDDLVGFLRERGAAGILAGCDLLPESVRRLAYRNDRFCCMAF
jgi:hypothetical protein